MRRRERPMITFRRRLLQLIDQHFDGRYTALAHRAGVPVSTMQHYVHNAKHLPGGEHLLRMAAALGITVQYLMTGQDAVRPVARPEPLVPLVPPAAEPVAPTTRTIPLVRCGCPAACPLTEAEPPVAAATSTVLLPAELLPRHPDHRLIALQVGEPLPCAEWRDGTRLVMDVDARTPAWEALALVHAEGRLSARARDRGRGPAHLRSPA
jgi:transcriptional regulator with XRE-family HTH domain